MYLRLEQLRRLFFDAVTIQNIKQAENIIAFVEQRNNLIRKDSYCNVTQNIATGTVINENTTTHLLSCTDPGKIAYEKFIDERNTRQSKTLFDVMTKAKTT